MAITAADLLAPTGALTTELLLPLRTQVTGATTATQVADAYAAAGAAKVSAWTDAVRADRGAVAWATYRALMDRAQQILAQAMSAGADSASESFSSAQAVELQKAAAGYLNAFEVEAADETGSVSASQASPARSRSVPVTAAW